MNTALYFPVMIRVIIISHVQRAPPPPAQRAEYILMSEGVRVMDSVLQKAEELESSLKSWREKLNSSHMGRRAGPQPDVTPSCTPPQHPVEEYVTPTPPQHPTEDVTPTPPQHPTEDVFIEGGAEEGGVQVQGAWHQLTSYIVQLEERVREMGQSAGGLGGHAAGLQESVAMRGSPHGDMEGVAEAEHLVQTDSHNQALLLVFMWLTTAELCVASQVCCAWRAISHHPQLWRTVTLRETVLSSQDLSTLGRWCRNTHTIILHGLMPEMAGPDEELHSYIARQKGSLEPGLTTLLSAAPQLTSLSVTECNLMITERLLWLASVHCPLLRHFSYTSDEFPPTPAALWALSNGCTQLQSLHLPPYLGSSPFCNYFNDFCLSAIAKGWPHLLQLTVGGAGITAAGLSEIVSEFSCTVRYCPWLEELSIEYGPQLSSSDVADMTAGRGLACLHSLSLSFTPISPKALHQLTTACPRLSSLTLHISPNTYFPGTATDSKALNKYHQIHLNFQELQRMPQLKEVFHLHHHPLTTTTVI